MAIIACMTLTSFVIVIQKRTVAFHAVRAHHGIIDFELVDKVDGRHAGNTAVQRADDAGCDDDRVIRTCRNDGGDVDIVGNNPQAAAPPPALMRGFHGRTDTDEQRRTVGDVFRNQPGNGVFRFDTGFGGRRADPPASFRPKMRRRDGVSGCRPPPTRGCHNVSSAG